MRKRSSDTLDGDEYAHCLRRGGVSHRHLEEGRGFGTGKDAKLLEAIWGLDWGKTVEAETNKELPPPHVFNTKYPGKRRGRKKSP